VVQARVRRNTLVRRLFVELRELDRTVHRQALCGPQVLPRGVSQIPIDVPVPADVESEELVWTAWAIGEDGARIASATEAVQEPFFTAETLAPGTSVSRTFENNAAAVAADLGIEREGSVLIARSGAVSARIQLDRVSGWSQRLVGRISYPPLGLGLQLSMTRDVPLPGNQLRVGDSLVGTARDAKQALTFLGRMHAPLGHVLLESLDDRGAVVLWRHYDMTRVTLGQFSLQVVALVHALAAALASMPPPSLFEEHLPGWRRLAQELQGTLDVARMAVTGHYRGSAVTITTTLPVGSVPSSAMRIVLQHPAGVDPSRELDVDVDEHSHLDVPAVASASFAALAPHLLYLTIRRGLVTADVRSYADRPRELLAVLHRLEAFAADLGGARAPAYR
jgi:hypothetical protein